MQSRFLLVDSRQRHLPGLPHRSVCGARRRASLPALLARHDDRRRGPISVPTLPSGNGGACARQCQLCSLRRGDFFGGKRLEHVQYLSSRHVDQRQRWPNGMRSLRGRFLRVIRPSDLHCLPHWQLQPLAWRRKLLRMRPRDDCRFARPDRVPSLCGRHLRPQRRLFRLQ